MTLTLDFHDQIFDSHILGMERLIDLEWKRCELDTMLYAQWACFWATVHGKKISFQSVAPWMGYSFTDLGAEGCCRSLNALFKKLSSKPYTSCIEKCKILEQAKIFSYTDPWYGKDQVLY